MTNLQLRQLSRLIEQVAKDSKASERERALAQAILVLNQSIKQHAGKIEALETMLKAFRSR